MSFQTRSITFDLSPVSIDQASEWLIENQEEIGVEKSSRIRTRLLFEEALLNIAEHYGAGQEATAFLEKRMTNYRLRLVVKGSRFNPLKSVEDEQSDWSSSLFSLLGARIQYSYSMGENILRIPIVRPSMNPVLKILIAIATGVVFGILGNVLMPSMPEQVIADTILNPIADMWVRLLQAISGPIIFFTALTAAFGTKRISDYGGSRFTTLARYFGISTVVVVFTMFCSFLLFGSHTDLVFENRQTPADLLKGILALVPGNLFEPFFSANTPQLLLIAIVAGYAIATIESQIPELKRIIQQMNLLGLTIAKLACALVPYFVGLLLCLRIWSREVDLLELIWMPLIVSVGISAVVFLVILCMVAIRTHTPPLLLARKLRGPFWEAIKSGALDYASVADLADSCKRSLGIDGDYAEAVLPQGLVLYMPTSAVGICVFVLFAAQAQHIVIDPLWILSAAALAVVLAVATPPLNGANLLAFVVAFGYLGISSDAFLDVMVFDIVFGVFCIALDQALLQLETVMQADRLGFLDEDVLHAPLA